jgi:hypothetical protein
LREPNEEPKERKEKTSFLAFFPDFAVQKDSRIKG